jgi:hypothetical protein
LTSISGTEAVLEAKAGYSTYVYHFSKDSVEIVLPSPEIVALHSPQPRDVLTEQERIFALAGLSAAAPAGAIGSMQKIATATEKAPRSVRTLAALAGGAVMISGGWLGYRVGYKDELNYDAPNFVRGLRDPANWRPYAQRLVECELIREGLAALGERSQELESRVGWCSQFTTWAKVK